MSAHKKNPVNPTKPHQKRSRRNYHRRMNYIKGRKHTRNRWLEWSVQDEATIMDSIFPDRTLSMELGRSVQAIQAHRCKLRKQFLTGGLSE